MGQHIEITCPDGTVIDAYLALSGRGDAAPTVVVIQEWWGLNAQIKSTADRFAEHGFNALAPDLYGGSVTDVRDEAAHLMENLDWVHATRQGVRGAVQYQKRGGGRCAVLGYCLGGALTIIAAVDVPEMDAGVCFYGIPPRSQVDPAQLRVPLQGHFALHDEWCTPQQVQVLSQSLSASNKTFEFYDYACQHGFCNGDSAAYDQQADAQSWQRMTTFLNTHLG